MKRILRSSGLAGGIAAVVALAAIPMLATIGAQPAADVMTPGEIVSPAAEEGSDEENPVQKAEDLTPANPVYHEVTADENSGIYGANYTFTLNGVVHGYNIVTDTRMEGDWVTDDNGNQEYVEKKIFSITDAVIKGAKSPYTHTYIHPFVKIAIPEDCYGAYNEDGERQYVTYDITKAEFHHDLVNEGVQTSFPRYTADEIAEIKENYVKEDKDEVFGDPSHIIVSPYVKDVRWTGKFDITTTNFHFSSEEVPHLSADEYATGKLTFWVPEKLYYGYREHIKENYSSLTVVVRSEAPLTPVQVNVAEPGTLAQEIVKLVENLETVRYVIVTGMPNQEDLRMFRRMPNLEVLDLSKTTGLTEVSGLNGMENLRVVELPNTIERINDYAFEKCEMLESINIPDNVTYIGYAAFNECGRIRSIKLPTGLKRIEGAAFFCATALEEINLENLECIERRAFDGTNISVAILPNIIELYTGFSPYMEVLEWGDKLERLGSYQFHADGPAFDKIIIPNSFRSAAENTFQNKVKCIEIAPKVNLESVHGDFLQDIEVDTIIWKPLFNDKNIFGSEQRALKTAVVYVPQLTYNEYLINDIWAVCKDIRPIEEDLKEVLIDRQFTLRSEKGLAEKAAVIIDLHNNREDYGHLTVNRKLDLPLGQFEMNGRAMRGEYWTGNYYKEVNGYIGSTFIPKSTVTADEAVLNLSMRKDQWHFLSFPFDVKVSEIEVEDEALWVVRRYSGEDRANLTGNTWQNLQADDLLEAGKGYIFHCTKDNGDDVQFTFRPAADNSGLFNTGNAVTALQAYPSEFAHNAHWNLVGNSYPAYLSLRGVNFDAPVTVWDGDTYVAYSPVDDDYAFSPFQAFFVQMQETEGGDALTLDARARAHSSEEALAIEIEEDPVVDPTDPETPAERPAFRAARAAATDRALFNITLSDGTASDRARLVINEGASLAYEPSRDASKFMSSANGVPQIFVMNGNERMAIDERPYGEGVYTLGVRFGKSGEYSVSLDGKNIEGYVAILTDNLTGVSTEISSVPYAFTADAGTDEGRFTLELRSNINTGIDGAAADGISISAENGLLTVKAPAEVEITVAAADGRLMAADKGALLTVELPEGVYVVKAGETVRKINIR